MLGIKIQLAVSDPDAACKMRLEYWKVGKGAGVRGVCIGMKLRIRRLRYMGEKDCGVCKWELLSLDCGGVEGLGARWKKWYMNGRIMRKRVLNRE